MLATSPPRHGIVTDDVPSVVGLLQGVTEGPAWLPVVPLPEAHGGTGWTETLVVISADSLADAAPLVTSAAKRHHLSGLVVGIEDPEWFPQVLYESGLRTQRKTLLHDPGDDTERRRVLYALHIGAQDDLVARVRIEGDSLVVLTCALETLRVPFDAHPALRRLPASARPDVELSEMGHRLSWLGGGVEVDLDGLRYAIDPAYRAAVDFDTTVQNAGYGAAIRALRIERGLRQIDVPGLSARQVRRVERDGTTSLDALRALADAHDLPLDAYLDALADRAADIDL